MTPSITPQHFSQNQHLDPLFWPLSTPRQLSIQGFDFLLFSISFQLTRRSGSGNPSMGLSSRATLARYSRVEPPQALSRTAARHGMRRCRPSAFLRSWFLFLRALSASKTVRTYSSVEPNAGSLSMTGFIFLRAPCFHCCDKIL
jgi:hypothetical protein